MSDDGRHEDLAKAEASGDVPRLVAAPPGPESRALHERQEKVAWSGALDTMPIGVKRKHNATIEDVDGNLLIDMLTGWGATNVGATHPEVMAAAIDALRDYGQEIPDYISAPLVVELAEKLVGIAPDPLARVTFEISGTEAVESAMKFMRAKTERPFILTFLGQYHGESYGAQAVGSQASGYSRFMRELNNGYVHVPYPNPYRCPFHAAPADCDGVCVIDYLREQVLPYLVAADRVAGVMIEPIAGEAGVWIPPDPFWPALMELCDENGWLWCADEAQTLFGRCGPMFATELWDLHPDLMVLAKALSGGVLPIAACLGSEDVMGDSEVYAGGTYSWFPPSCAAALKGIEVLERDDMLEKGRRLERIALERLVPLAEKYEIVGEARVKGLYIGIEFVKDKESKEKAIEEARAVHFNCLERGIVDIYDRGMNVVRWQPALTMPEDMLMKACDILEESIAAVDGAR
ncbi:MAG: aminotransferase class III-fold pyridoxal phosphate-dependent enzyme [Actinomycetota bacterium]